MEDECQDHWADEDRCSWTAEDEDWLLRDDRTEEVLRDFSSNKIVCLDAMQQVDYVNGNTNILACAQGRHTSAELLHYFLYVQSSKRPVDTIYCAYNKTTLKIFATAHGPLRFLDRCSFGSEYNCVCGFRPP